MRAKRHVSSSAGKFKRVRAAVRQINRKMLEPQLQPGVAGLHFLPDCTRLGKLGSLCVRRAGRRFAASSRQAARRALHYHVGRVVTQPNRLDRDQIMGENSGTIARLQFLASLGASPVVAEELVPYLDRRFQIESVDAEPALPLAAERHVERWSEYAAEAASCGAFAALRKRLVQLQFPVCEGISQTESYRVATRRGIATDGMPEASGLTLSCPDRLRLVIHESLAGPIPVLIACGRADFVTLLQALAHRNEPVLIPDSLGAMMIAGYNNWDRVRQLRLCWEAEHGHDVLGDGWAREFQEHVVPHRELYQDRFILVSDGPYSGVPAAELGLAIDEWQQLSVAIRLEHECTHYFTRRVFGSMQNHVLDELIADYRGIVAATGCFRADWFLRFMGLENYPEYRPSGRLGYYRGEPPLSDAAFRVLQTLVKRAAENVEQFNQQYANRLGSRDSRLRSLMALSRMTLDELAAAGQGG